MRINGQIKHLTVMFLIDSGSIHNFIVHSIIKRLGYYLQFVPGVSVAVANGAKMVTHDICRAVKWETQGLQQSTDFLVLPLRGCDVVLGVHWLK